MQAEAQPAERLRAARLHCLLEVLYATGPARLRTGRAAGVRRASATQRMLVVRGKGGKERLVPLNEQAPSAP